RRPSMFRSTLIALLALTPFAAGQCPDEPLPIRSPVIDAPRMPLAKPYEGVIDTPAAGKVSESKKVAPKDVVLRWNEAALFAIRTERTPAPVAARNLALVHTAIYDAVNSVARSHQPFYVGGFAPRGTSPEVAAAVAA